MFCKSSQIVSGSTILLRETSAQPGTLKYKNFEPEQLENYEKHFGAQQDSSVLEQTATKNRINSADFSDYPEIDLHLGIQRG